MAKKKQKAAKEKPAEETPVAETTAATDGLQQQYDELQDKHLRLLAEFENFRKRSVRDKIDLMKTAAQDTMTALLPVLDDFIRAKKSADADDSIEAFSDGVNLVYQKLFSVLKTKGLEVMETNGHDFDPEFHEAMAEIPAANEDQKGKIIDTIEQGYILNDRIIRHAKVVVGK